MAKLDSAPIGSPPNCSSCGSQDVSESIEEQKFIYDLGNDAAELCVSVPVYHCHDCDFFFTDHVAEGLRHKAVCNHLGVLSPAEIKGIRKQYGLSRKEFANITKLGEASLARWESGQLIQNVAYDVFLRILADPAVFERLKAGLFASATSLHR